MAGTCRDFGRKSLVKVTKTVFRLPCKQKGHLERTPPGCGSTEDRMWGWQCAHLLSCAINVLARRHGVSCVRSSGSEETVCIFLFHVVVEKKKSHLNLLYFLVTKNM